ncbi:hypothetical protein [Burkholderia cenocepacia]|uniref:hypothetical protein n=1 Tax=Burkholderia cenocepacia TaxID=95486 RepID=UPI0028763F49|nr:hypothetical protein [Burkholderia cenocepacia]MDS0849098.1 hypothetical protein [Burkholderia cenocepacia]
MKEPPDFVAIYGASLGFSFRSRTVLVEGTTDVDLFKLAARLEFDKTGIDLLGDELAIVAAGERDRGGTHGVIRELVSLRGMARTCLLPNGRPRYRFIGLFDNDLAGKQAVKLARQVDSSILEYKDIFRLWPRMPLPGNMDPVIVKNCFERENSDYNALDWELEDILPGDFMEAFLSENPMAVARTKTIAGKTHRDLTRDGKARLHRFVAFHAVHDDLRGVIDTLKAIRFYLNILPSS